MTDCWVSHTGTNITEVDAICVASCAANWQSVNQNLATPKTEKISLLLSVFPKRNYNLLNHHLSLPHI